MLTAKELEALAVEYARLNTIYMSVRADMIEDAIEAAERTDSFADCVEAYAVYNEARKVRIRARNDQIYYGRKK
jgi:hypothetical protein